MDESIEVRQVDKGPFQIREDPLGVPGVPIEMTGVYSKKGRGPWMRQVVVPVELAYVTVHSAIEQLTAAQKRAGDGATVDVESYEEYGSTRVNISVTGTREATEEEIVWVKKAQERRRAFDREREDRAAEQARELLRRRGEIS